MAHVIFLGKLPRRIEDDDIDRIEDLHAAATTCSAYDGSFWESTALVLQNSTKSRPISHMHGVMIYIDKCAYY